MFDKHIPEIEEKIGYVFRDKSLLRQAFTRTSYSNERRGKNSKKIQSSEVLEFIGDSVLSAAIVTLLMDDGAERYEYGILTKLNEGDFSNIRSKLSDKRNLSNSMQALGLQKYLRMGEGDAKLGIENEPSVMEDLFESIVGAVYIDCGMDISCIITVVSGMLDVSAYFSGEAAPIQSYKNALQEWCADKKHRLPAPIYKTVSETGPDHQKIYQRAVYIGDRMVAIGNGKNQKIADSAAAEGALEILKKESENHQNVNITSLSALKNYASKNNSPSPEFRDLGETPNSTASDREYMIECRCMGKVATATGKSKQEARASAAEKVINDLMKRETDAIIKTKKASNQHGKNRGTKGTKGYKPTKSVKRGKANEK